MWSIISLVLILTIFFSEGNTTTFWSDPSTSLRHRKSHTSRCLSTEENNSTYGYSRLSEAPAKSVNLTTTWLEENRFPELASDKFTTVNTTFERSSSGTSNSLLTTTEVALLPSVVPPLVKEKPKQSSITLSSPEKSVYEYLLLYHFPSWKKEIKKTTGQEPSSYSFRSELSMLGGQALQDYKRFCIKAKWSYSIPDEEIPGFYKAMLKYKEEEEEAKEKARAKLNQHTTKK